jgi:hypothetical protein
MDNKIFNVNGRTKEQLTLAVKLLLLDEYNKNKKVSGWYFNQKKGFVLTWSVHDGYKAMPFTNRMGVPTPIEDTELVDILWEWLHSDEAKTVTSNKWEGRVNDDDVSEEMGWRLYTEDWGHVNETGSTIDHYSIAAFKMVYCWYGK